MNGLLPDKPNNLSLPGPALDWMASEVENVSAEVVPRSGSESEPVMQHERVPLLAACDQARLCSALKEATVPVLSGWTPAYLRWWQEQVRSQ